MEIIYDYVYSLSYMPHVSALILNEAAKISIVKNTV